VFTRYFESLSDYFSRPVALARWSWNWWQVWHTLPIFPWIKGADCFRRGDYRSAATHYLRGINKHPTHKAAFCAHLDYAYCLYRIGNLNEAARALSKVTLTRSPIKDAFLLLARIQMFTGDPESAIGTLRRGMLNFRKDNQLVVSYVNCVINAKGTPEQLEEARDLLEALRMRIDLNDPLMVALDSALACYEVRYGDYERGQQLLSRVIATGTAPFDAVLLRGESMLEEGLTFPGRGLIARAMSMSPADPRPAIALAKSYLADSETAEPRYAIQLATNACQLSQWQSIEALQLLMEAYNSAGESSIAELVQERLRTVAASREVSLEQIRDAEVQIQRLRSAKLA
jgi:tetratricopeptide (TPR) repeat protein